jgi:glyoxylase I family protein
MKILKYLHTAILVSDLTKSEYFYSEVLGLSKIERSLKYPGVWYQLDNFQLHLIVEPKLNNKLINQNKWGRNPHIALAIDNLEEVKNHLENRGYSLQMSVSGRKALFTQDPDGNILELTQI